MTFDGFYTFHMINELKERLIGGRVSKIHHPNIDEVVFTVRSNGKNWKLLINVSAHAHRVQLTQQTFANPDFPTNFCMVLRKRLEGAKLQNIQQVGLDRIMTFIFEGSDDIGDTQIYHLTVELMGKHSNLFLINPETNHILDCIKHIPIYKNTHRTILPNAQYVLPPNQDKYNPLDLSINQLDDVLQNAHTPKDIQQKLQGLSLSTLTQIFNYQAQKQLSTAQAIQSYCTLQTQGVIIDNDFYAVNAFNENHYSLLSEQLDHFYKERAVIDRVHHLTHAIRQKLNAICLRNQNKLEKITQEIEQAENSETYRIKGELLTANSYRIERGMTSVTLENFYDNYEPITITLKPEKNATQNAKDYFKKYQKLKTSIQHLTTQKELIISEINYLESVLVELDHALLNDVEDIKFELINSGYIKEKNNSKKLKQSKNGPLQFKSPDGTSILVGRNNLQNDQLTLKQSKKDYIWLHTKDIPGSHVIIQNAQPSEETLQLGAQLAAFYSKFKYSSNVPVDYVAIQHIKKPNGAKPGFVIYEKQKTLLVTPIENELKVYQVID